MNLSSVTWSPWAPDDVARILDGVGVPWCIAGGWALELWDGRLARAHADIEIVVLRNHFPALRSWLERQFQLYAVANGAHLLLQAADAFPGTFKQCRVRDGGHWRLDVMLDPGDDVSWVFRRDPRLSAPRDRVVRRSASGLRFLAPEIVLLFKAKGDRAKDQADFEAALPLLDRTARIWLARALLQTLPDHPWIARLLA